MNTDRKDTIKATLRLLQNSFDECDTTETECMSCRATETIEFLEEYLELI